MGKPWSAIAVGSFAAAYYIYWSSSWQDGNDYSRGTTRVRPSAPQITIPEPTPTPPSVPIGKTAEQKAAEQEAARQEAARQEAARQEAARQEAARKAAEQKAAEQKAAEQKAEADKRKAEEANTKEKFAKAYALESTYPDWWPGSKAPNVINHHPLIVEMLNKANSLGVLELYEDKSAGFPLGPRLLLPPMRSEDNMKAAKQTLAQFKEMKAAVWADIYPADRQIVNLIINYLGGLIRKAEIINEARIQNAKARAAYEAAVAAAAPNVQTNYLITLQNPVEVSILIGILNKTGKMHIRESRTKKVVLSTGPWGNNIKPKSSNNDGYVDALDLLKLPINPREVDKVNRKMLEAGMDEYGTGYKLTFTDRSSNKVLIELDLGSPTSVTDVPVDRANSEIDDIGRNIRYSATVVSYQA